MNDFKRVNEEQFWIYRRVPDDRIGWVAWSYAPTRDKIVERLSEARGERADLTFIAVKETTTFEPLDL